MWILDQDYWIIFVPVLWSLRLVYQYMNHLGLRKLMLFSSVFVITTLAIKSLDFISDKDINMYIHACNRIYQLHDVLDFLIQW